MKKWLVGLMAAGLCAASASAETNTVAYFVQNKAVTVMQGVAPEGSSAIYSQTYNGTSGQATGGTSITLTLKGYEGTTVTGLRLAMHSNSKTGAGSLSATCGDAIIGSIADAPFNDQNWYGAWSQIFVDVTVPVTPTVIDDDIVITIAASSNSLYCEEFYIDYIPAVPTFSVSLDPGDDFTAVLDTPTDIRAIAENATGSVEYAWTLDGEPTDVLGDTFIVDTSVSGGSHEVVCVATDTGTGATSEASVNYTVVGAYTVTVADGIENGSVAVWGGETELGNPADVLEGTTLKVVAMPATRSYKVESITVTGETSGEITLENDEFTMPAENVFVTATFAERSGDLFEKITSEDELEAGAYVITGASADGTEYAMLNEANTSTATDHIKRKETPEDVSFDSISGPEDSVIWTLAKDDTGWTIHNADGGYVCYVPNMGNSANLEGEPSSKSHWTIAATEHGLFEVSNVGDSTRVLRYNPDNPRFACYSNPSSGKSLAFYKRSGSGTFSLSLDPSGEDVVFAEGEGGAITATAKNAQGEVTYAWNVTQDDTPGSANGNVWTIPADAPAGGPWTVYCAATDGTSEADQSVSFSIVAAPVVYEVTIAENIENGTVTVEPASGVAGTAITVTATPDPGYALVAIQVNGEDIAGNVFEMPEGGALVGATFEESAVKIATYTVASTDAVEATGDVPAGSEAEYSSTYGTPCQLLGGTHMTLKLKGYEGATITGLALSMRSNSRGGAGSLDAVCGDAVIATIADSRFNEESWYGSWSQNYVPITPAVAPTVVDDDVVITIAASANSLYCESFTIEYESGSPVFSVTLDPAEHFDVIQGEEATITATAKNAVGDVTYAWTVDGEPQATIGPIFTLESVVVGGPHEVVCVATDTGAEGVTAEASVSYTVAAPTPSYAVAVADGIENGEVAVDKAEAKAGETVTVTATPDDGYVLEAILVDGEPIGGDSFEMPDHDVTVSATFSPVADYATLPFLADNTPFTGPWQNAKAAGVTVGGLGTDYNSADGRGARFDDTGDWLQIKFEGTPDELSYALKGNGVSGDYVFDVQESATGGEGPWTTVASYPANGELKQSKAAFTNELSDNSRFVRFVYSTKAGGNVALYDVYISSGEFSVSFDKEDGFEVEQGTADRISATVKNGEEPYYFIWSCEQAAALNAEDEGLDTLVIPATLGVGDYTVEVLVLDGQGEMASKTISFSVVEPAAKYPVSIADGILNGDVAADVAEAAEGDTVTLTATPEPGFKLGTITVTYGEETLEFTTSPATFEMPAAGVYVDASFVESHDEIFMPVESEAEFAAGEEYLIVAHKDGTFTDALKNAANGTRIGVDAVAIEADGYVKTDNADIVWKILAGAEEGQYVLFNEAASVYAAATRNDNVAQLLEDGTDPLAQWTLDLSALPAVKIVSVSYTNRCLQRNNSTAYFATYTGTQTTPMLFKKVESLEFTVSVDKTGFELPLGEGTIVTASAKFGVGDITYVWTSETEELNGAGALLEIPATLAAGEYTATVTATDSSEPPQTDTATVEFTVAAPPVSHEVKVEEDIPNGTVVSDKAEAVAGETVTLTAEPAEGWKLWRFLLNGEPIGGDSFEMPDGEVTVSAEFRKLHPVTLDQEIANGSIEADKTEAMEGETVTLTAIPDDGWQLGKFFLNGAPLGGNTFEMPEGEALVTAEFVETVKVLFVPVESASDFVAGEEYLLVAVKEDAYASAMKNAANGTRIGVDEVEIAEDGSITTDNADIVWTIRAGAEADQYVLFSETGGVYAAGPDSAGNNAKLVTDGMDALAQWTLDFAALPEVKVGSVSYEGRWLQRNGDKNNKFFATYTGSQVNPRLYKKAGFAVGFDKEDGFTVEAGTADSITATALRGTEPYSYVWTGDLEGDGATLAIPDDLAEGEYAVKVTATDSSEPPLTAEKEISFTVVPPTVRYAVTVAEDIVGGEVSVDKTLAEAGETVTVTATPAAGYELVDIRVDGEPIGGDTFEMPAQAVEVSATFREIVDYVTLPFVAEDTPYRGPWKNPEVAGLTHNGLASDYDTDGEFGAKFRTAGVWMQIKFNGTPGNLTYGIKGNGLTEESGITFLVQESADGETWADLAVYTSDGNLGNDRKDETAGLSEDSRFVRFFLEAKSGEGNVGIYDVYISEAGAAEPAVAVAGETTVRLGDTFELALALENYAGGAYTWTNNVLFGTIDAGTATFWWTPPRTGEFPVTFSAMDGNRTIASATVTLAVFGEPELVFDGDDGGTVGTPVTFTVEAEYVADPAVTFMGFLDVPEGSALTDADVTVDFPNVTFTPDVAGDYGLAFSAGTTGVDYVEDAWIVTVAAAPLEPVVALVDGETTVELGDYFLLQFGLENYTGEFTWTADVGDIDGDGYFTWTPGEAGEFPVVVSAVAGEETIASTTVTLTVTDETPPPVSQPEITKVEIDVAAGVVTLEFSGTGVEVWGTDDLMGITDQWAPMETVVEGNTALVEMKKHFLRVQ